MAAKFAGAGLYQPSSASAPFTITKEETTLSYTGDTIIANNTTANVSGVLLEDGAVPIVSRQVAFTLGTGATAQTCTGTTDPTGRASCPIVVNQPPGPGVRFRQLRWRRLLLAILSVRQHAYLCLP